MRSRCVDSQYRLGRHQVRAQALNRALWSWAPPRSTSIANLRLFAALVARALERPGAKPEVHDDGSDYVQDSPKARHCGLSRRRSHALLLSLSSSSLPPPHPTPALLLAFARLCVELTSLGLVDMGLLTDAYLTRDGRRARCCCNTSMAAEAGREFDGESRPSTRIIGIANWGAKECICIRAMIDELGMLPMLAVYIVGC